MSEFKVPPYLYFYPSDWLNDPEVRRLPEGPKSFYIDLICQLHLTLPYGYCSLINPKKKRHLELLVNQKSNQEANLRVELLLKLSVADQLKVVENLEPELYKYLPYPQERIAEYIRFLEDRSILVRSPSGVLFQRRMVKDFKRRVTAYLNGSKGGNPGMKQLKISRKNGKINVPKKQIDKDLQNLPNQKSNQVGYSTADPIISINNTGRVGEARGENSEKVKGVFQMQGLYDKSFKQLEEVKYSKKLTAEGFQGWKNFVDWIIEMEFDELFVSKFIDPPDFQDLMNKGFTHTRLEPIIRKILSTGIKPEHKLYFRIPEYEKYVKTDEKKNSGSVSKSPHILKKKDYGSMKGGKNSQQG